jgi:hypothetical protein
MSYSEVNQEELARRTFQRAICYMGSELDRLMPMEELKAMFEIIKNFYAAYKSTREIIDMNENYAELAATLHSSFSTPPHAGSPCMPAPPARLTAPATPSEAVYLPPPRQLFRTDDTDSQDDMWTET